MFSNRVVADEKSSIVESQVVRDEYLELISKVATELKNLDSEKKLDSEMNASSDSECHLESSGNETQFMKKVGKFIKEEKIQKQKYQGEENGGMEVFVNKDYEKIIIAAVIDSFSKASRDLEVKLNLASGSSASVEDNKVQYLDNIKEIVTSFINGDLFSSEHSLLLVRDIIGSVPNKYNLDIVELAINKCDDVNPRDGEGEDKDLINIMVRQRVMSSDPDLSNMFDLMVSKGLQMPDEDVIKKFVTDSRIRSGNNAKKLAQSFINIGDDSSFIDTIIRSQNELENTVNLRDKHFIKSEIKSLKKFYIESEARSSTLFLKKVDCFVTTNDDNSLKMVFGDSNAATMLEEAASHASPLTRAIDQKHLVTFNILIDAGLDPLKYSANETPPFSHACIGQSGKTLRHYLKRIEEKYDDNKVREVVNHKDASGKTPLTYAVEGKAYINSINALLENGADITDNYQNNLNTLIKKGDAGVLDLFLRSVELEQSEVLQVAEMVKENGDYVTTSVFLEYLKEKSPDAGIEVLKTEIENKISTLKPQDLYLICQSRGDRALRHYIDNMKKIDPEYKVEDHINEFDEHGRSPLYYAVANNSYDKMVKLLLSEGANPNLIQGGDSEKIDAVSLSIKNMECETLSILLNSDKITDATINKAAQELLSQNTNDYLMTAFISNLDSERLRRLPQDVKEDLFLRSLDLKDGLYGCATKMISENVMTKSEVGLVAKKITKENFDKIDDLFIEAIQKEEVSVVRTMIEDLAINNLISIYKESSYSIDSSSESTPLLERQHSSGYGALPKSSINDANTKRIGEVQPLDSYKYLDEALKVANAGNTSSKKVVEILLENEFKSSKSDIELDKDLKKLGIRSNSMCPVSCAVM